MKRMKQGGISSSTVVQQITRWSGLLISSLISVYILLTIDQTLPDATYQISTLLSVIIALAWCAAGILQFLFFGTSRRNALVRTIGYHSLAVASIVLVTGFATFPFIFCWGVLSAVSYMDFSIRGVWLNLAALWLVALADAVLHPSVEAIFVNNAITALSIFIVIAVFVQFFKVQERDDAELTSSKKTEKLERERLLTIVNNIVDAVVSLDADGKIETYNAATLNLLDTNETIISRDIDSIIKLENEEGERIKFLPILRKSKSITTDEDYYITAADERIRLELTFSPIRSSYDSVRNSAKNDGYVIIFRDITKAKSLEEERDEFISVVSHELRTPIAITEGAIDNARIIFTRPGSKKVVIQKTLEMAHEQVIFLSKMVNDLSTLSRAERGVGDEIETIDVTAIAKSLLDDYEPVAAKKDLAFNLGVHGNVGSVQVSRLYLHELLQNFITNSIKYTKTGQINLSVTAHDGTITFAVSDTGIGISKKDQKKVFQKFYRSEDYRTRETGGTGLGLYVAQKLARKMNTTIDVKSRLNHGSTFSFALPQTSDTAASRSH